MTQVQLEKLVSAIVSKAVAAQGVSEPKAKRTKAEMLAAKDRSIKATFTKRGVKDVVLMDRTDPTKPFNVKPYKAWIAEGRQVRSKEKSVRGLFHISQTDEIEAAE